MYVHMHAHWINFLGPYTVGPCLNFGTVNTWFVRCTKKLPENDTSLYLSVTSVGKWLGQQSDLS